MRSLELLRHASIGQYVPGDSLIHRTDARGKLLGFISLIAAATLCTSYGSHLLLLSLCVLGIASAGISLRRVLAALRPAVPAIVLMAGLQLLFYGSRTPGDTTLWEFRVLRITSGGIRTVVVSIARLLELLSLVSLLTGTATMAHLSRATAWLLRPLDAIGLPGHDVSLVFVIALRFLPILALQLETIAKAQISRGANLSVKRRWKFVGTTRRMLALIVPLFLDAFRRAERLAVAMEARCSTGDSPVSRVAGSPRWQAGDLIGTVAAVLLSLALVIADRTILN
jgi:energy-coupling factor transport system permease protein